MICISIIAFVGVFFIQSIAQDLSYHNFVDDHSIFDIPNFWNVASNIPFLIVGVLGLWQFKRFILIENMRIAYWLLFFGLIMVAFGSGYYHLDPNNHTLVWDRLPMTVAFMSLFVIIVSEFIDERIGKFIFFPFLFLGIGSVLYWQWNDDLRFYALVQFLPIILMPIIIFKYTSKFSKVFGYWWLLLAYVLAKVFEYYDSQIFNLCAGIMSGHSMKHFIAALGMYILLRSYLGRLRLEKDS
jgi:hypothetical protein